MKCPCCGQQSDKEMIISHDKLHMADGTTLFCRAKVLGVLDQFLGSGRVPRKPKAYSTRAQIKTRANDVAELRQFFLDHNLPFSIATYPEYYMLVRNSST